MYLVMEHPAGERLTTSEEVLGTIPYVAPEQLEGGPTDSRTDLWALGTLIHEMVTGRRAFEGTAQVGAAAAILESEPPSLRSLQPLAPPALERLVRRCLAKSPDERWDTAHDVAEELRWIAQVYLVPSQREGARWGWKRVGGAALMLAAAVAAGALADRALRVAPASRAPMVRSWLDVHPAVEVTTAARRSSGCPPPAGPAPHSDGRRTGGTPGGRSRGLLEAPPPATEP